MVISLSGLYFSICLFIMGQKTNSDSPIRAFIPIQNLCLLSEVADININIVLLSLLLHVGFFCTLLGGASLILALLALVLGGYFNIILWKNVAYNRDKPEIIGIAYGVIPSILIVCVFVASMTNSADVNVFSNFFTASQLINAVLLGYMAFVD